MKRILFVDDEPRVLDGLRRLLRGQRAEWEMAFADGGESALSELARAPFDVIVTDMRMPGIDGAALLQVVKERHPQVVRVVLSGYAEPDVARAAAAIAHHYLLKPCDPAALKAVVEGA
jgi:YesN/AraC family two-component response regulator